MKSINKQEKFILKDKALAIKSIRPANNTDATKLRRRSKTEKLRHWREFYLKTGTKAGRSYRP